jgi:MFS family permease
LRYAERSSSLTDEIVPGMASPQSELLPSSNQKLVLSAQIAFLPTGVLTTLLGPMLPILIARWFLNDTQAGNLFLVQFLAQLVGVQLSGFLLAKFGFRPAFLSGLLLMASGVGTLLIGSLALGLASVAVYGLGLGFIIPTDNLLVAEISAGSAVGSRAGAVSLLNFFWGVGAVFCSLMVAWTAAHGLLPFFLGAVALFLILLAFGMRNLPFPPAEKSSTSSGAPSFSWRALAKSRAVWLFAGVFFLYPGAETAVGGWIGSYVSRLGTRGAEMASLMPAFFWAALTVGRALGTAFLRHVSEGRVLRAGGGNWDRTDAMGSVANGSDWWSADYRAELLDVISNYGGSVVAALWGGGPQYWRGYVFVGCVWASGDSVDGRRDLAFHGQSAGWPPAAAGSYGRSVSGLFVRVVGVAIGGGGHRG